MVENRFKEMVFFHCRPWFPQELITASAICFEFWTYNHGQKSSDTFAFLGRFPIHVQPLPSPHKRCCTRVSKIFSEFQLCIVWGGGGRENCKKILKSMHFFKREPRNDRKYEFCSTVPRSFVQDCRLVTMWRKSDHVTRYWPYRGVGTCAFSSPEPLGLICNLPVAKKRRALGTRMVRVLQC